MKLLGPKVQQEFQKSNSQLSDYDIMFAVYLRHKIASFSIELIEFSSQTWIFLAVSLMRSLFLTS